MHLKNPLRAALVAAALTLSPAAALAQDANNTATDTTTTDLNATDTTMTNDTAYAGQQQEEDNDFPWGLLGLLGLAGLAGLRRRDNDIHVDARRNH